MNHLTLFCLLFFMLFEATVTAQNTRSLKNKAPKMGIEAGANIGAFWGANIQKGDKGAPGWGINTGIYGYFHLIGDVDFRPALKYSYNGASFNSSRILTAFPVKVDGLQINIDGKASVIGEVNLHYIEMPLEFVLNFGDRLALQLGPRLAYMYQGKSEGEILTYLGVLGIPADPEDLEKHLAIKQNVVDMRIGVGLSLKVTPKIQATFSIVTGFSTINTPNNNFSDPLKNAFASSLLAYNIFGNYY